MKHIFLGLIIVMAFLCCNSDEKIEGSTQQNRADSTITNITEKPVEIKSMMLTSFKVDNFEDWEKAFFSSPIANQQKYKVLYYNTSQEDENLVGLAKLTINNKEVKTRMETDKFKNNMKNMGVISEQQTMFLKAKWITPGSVNRNNHIVITHKVVDFNKWKEVFDADKPNRESAGLYDLIVATDEDDDNLVTVVLSTDDVEKCKEIFNNPEIEKTLERAGVLSDPTTSYWNVRFTQ